MSHGHLRTEWLNTLHAEQCRRPIDGLGTAFRLAAKMDDLLSSALRPHLKKLSGVTVFATGGYGRGQLAPHSDVDLLILSSDGSAGNDEIAEALYPLWDADLLISHSVHSVASMQAAAAEDIRFLTALFSARLVCGDRMSFGALDSALTHVCAGFKETDFIDALRALREAQPPHEIAIEPDVKRSLGCLRDVHAIDWMAQFRQRKADGRQGEAVQVLDDVLHLLWSIRVQLHFQQGRLNDQLTLELQPTLARTLLSTDEVTTPEVEQFMRQICLAMRRGAQAYDVVVAPESRLAHHASLSNDKPADVSKLLSALACADEADLLGFAAALRSAARGWPSYPVEAQMIARQTLLVDVFEKCEDPYPIIMLLANTDLLSQLVPSFGKSVGAVEYGLFREITEDGHILRSIKTLADLFRDTPGIDHVFPISAPLARAIRPRAPLYVALLLQGLSHGRGAAQSDEAFGGQAPKLMLQEVSDLIGDPTSAELVAFLVSDGDLLVEAAGRRNVTDTSVVAALARQIGSESRLDHLAVYVACRLHGAGRRSWAEYAKRDVPLLVQSIRIYLREGEEGLASAQSQRFGQLEAETRRQLPPQQKDQLNSLLLRAGEMFWAQADEAAAQRLAKLVYRVDGTGGLGGAVVHQLEKEERVQIVVYTWDRPEVFAAIAGLVSASGGSVWGASGFPLGAGRRPDKRPMSAIILQILRLGPDSAPVPFRLEAGEREKLEAAFTAAAASDSPLGALGPPQQRLGDRRAHFSVEPKVTLAGRAATGALIVEIEATDRPGLLASLARAVAELGLSIEFAFVGTLGHRAIDTFYVKGIPYGEGGVHLSEQLVDALTRKLEAT